MWQQVQTSLLCLQNKEKYMVVDKMTVVNLD